MGHNGPDGSKNSDYEGAGMTGQDRLRRWKLKVLLQAILLYSLIVYLLIISLSCSYNFKYDITLVQGEQAKIGDIVIVNEKPKRTTVSTDAEATVTPF